MAPSPTSRRPWAKAALALIPLLVLLVALEGILALLGLGDADDHLSSSRGFDRAADYIIPDPDVPGGWRTNMFDRGSEVTVAPRGDRARVLLVGGSNTQMFPGRELQRLLDAAGGGSNYEVVNLGREGYGSERVSILLEQAVPALEPDVVVIYSGHNEFIESGFARELDEAGPSPWLEPLRELRTVRWLSRALGDGGEGGDDAGAVPGSAAGTGDAGTAADEGDEPGETPRAAMDKGIRRPEPWVMAYPEFRELTYADALRYFDAYEANLRHMVEVCREGGARVVLCTLVSNMLTPPWSSKAPVELDEASALQVARRVAEAGKLLPEVVARPIAHEHRLRAMEWVPAVPDEVKAGMRALYQPGPLPELRPLTGVLEPGPASQVGGGRSIEGSHWPEPALWRPKVWELLDMLAALHAYEPTPAERAALLEASARCDEALALLADHPRAHFLKGIVALVLDDDATASAELAAAGRYDRAPRSVGDACNDRVRGVAREAGAPLVDAAARFRERSPDGVVGFEIMMDHCHLQPGARRVLMADLVPAVREAASR